MKFLDFFNIFLGIKEDDYFNDLIKAEFNLEERKPKKKGLKNIV